MPGRKYAVKFTGSGKGIAGGVAKHLGVSCTSCTAEFPRLQRVFIKICATEKLKKNKDNERR